MGPPDHDSPVSPPDARHHGLSHDEGDSAAPALEAVLESECVALLALEATRARIRFLPGDHDRAEADIGGAIDLLRHAITELRARFGGTPPSLLSLGFVARREDLGCPGFPPAGG